MHEFFQRMFIEYAVTKLGIVMLVLGAMHFYNMYNFDKMRRKGKNNQTVRDQLATPTGRPAAAVAAATGATGGDSALNKTTDPLNVLKNPRAPISRPTDRRIKQTIRR